MDHPAGFEPALRGPKPRVLPLRRQVNRIWRDGHWDFPRSGSASGLPFSLDAAPFEISAQNLVARGNFEIPTSALSRRYSASELPGNEFGTHVRNRTYVARLSVACSAIELHGQKEQDHLLRCSIQLSYHFDKDIQSPIQGNIPLGNILIEVDGTRTRDLRLDMLKIAAWIL
jgi:hypothetical protein